MIGRYIFPDVLTMAGFSGGEHGPNTLYDATYAPQNDGFISNKILGFKLPIRDANGDGWNDLLIASSNYPDDGLQYGAAAILAGGTYIPRDDTTTGVRDISVEEKTNAMSLWPNPVRDELNIAWRGDLSRTPRKFSVHDLLGREVAHGEVALGTSAALWRCADVLAGVYLLSILDERGMAITTARIVKQ